MGNIIYIYVLMSAPAFFLINLTSVLTLLSWSTKMTIMPLYLKYRFNYIYFRRKLSYLHWMFQDIFAVQVDILPFQTLRKQFILPRSDLCNLYLPHLNLSLVSLFIALILLIILLFIKLGNIYRCCEDDSFDEENWNF